MQDELDNWLSPQQKAEIARLRSLPEAPTYLAPDASRSRPNGVLLSDEIEYYCKHFALVSPYEPKNIMAASYELRVGKRYAVGGEQCELNLRDVLTIPKFEVAVIEILETINMPRFLIGRWNIRTKWAYQGLIWVGGPQVNPGYRGRLMCPIWNLSNKDFKIECGEAIAVMDFVATSTPTELSNFKPLWDQRSRYIFEDYKPSELRSGLIEETVNKIKRLEQDSVSFGASLRNEVAADRKERIDGFAKQSDRLDTITAVMFTALGVTISAVAFFGTKKGGDRLWDQGLFWFCSAVALMSLLAWSHVTFSNKRRWIPPVVLLCIFASFFAINHERLRREASTLRLLERRVQELGQANEHLQKELDGLVLNKSATNK